ncbi:MAG: DNA topoisomerase IV subunit A [Alphaproteobacteria bacterium]|nr:DNA topoisomerase IV subunit A [Alphaproteobacteria bacterium]
MSNDNDTIESDKPLSTRVNLREALEERYLAYALSTIMHRALPDIRDGMKPVHRRLLYAMHKLKLDPKSGFKKCARVVGDVIGKYHPHGDQSVYDALVRLAQEFAVRYPLVEGQGNFGSIDGDNAAAMRYTESRMTEVASRLLEDLDQDTVDFRLTYDGEEEEPMVLPANFPNLLANGSTGIAVGMATSIPPHNVAEICSAALHLIKHRTASVETLMKYMPGPDLPTGGVIIEPHANILKAYVTGRGSIRVRAAWHKEELGRGGYRIVITEIPYQVQKSKLIERIADQLFDKKIPLVGDIFDESAEDIRLIIEPKNRNIDPLLLMESLFRVSDLETRISLNMNVLTDGLVPRVLPLNEIILGWIDHRQVVLVRKSNYRLEKIARRLEILSGLIVAFLNLDEVIRIIRYEDEVKPTLIETFTLTDVQAEAILNMRLRSLRKLEEMELRRENDELCLEQAGLQELVDSEDLQWKVISDSMKELRKQFGEKTKLGKRRTQFEVAPDVDLDSAEAFIEKESITIICSAMGWIRALKGHQADMSKLTYKTGDEHKFAFHAETTDKILICATDGRIYTVGADKFPGGRGHGEPLRLLIDVAPEVEIFEIFIYKADQKRLIVASDGRGFVVNETDLLSNAKRGKQVLNVKSPVTAKICTLADGNHLAVIGLNRKLLIYKTDEVNELSKGRGVMLQRYKDGGVSDAITFNIEDGLHWFDAGGRNRTVTELDDWIGVRAQTGRMPPRGFPANNKFKQ